MGGESAEGIGLRLVSAGLDDRVDAHGVRRALSDGHADSSGDLRQWSADRKQWDAHRAPPEQLGTIPGVCPAGRNRPQRRQPHRHPRLQSYGGQWWAGSGCRRAGYRHPPRSLRRSAALRRGPRDHQHHDCRAWPRQPNAVAPPPRDGLRVVRCRRDSVGSPHRTCNAARPLPPTTALGDLVARRVHGIRRTSVPVLPSLR